MAFSNIFVHVPLAANLYSRLRGAKRDWSDRRKLKAAEVVIVSFPKSGRTYVRTMLARLFKAEHGIDDRHVLKFSELRGTPPAVPKLLFTHDGDAMRTAAEIKVDAALYAGKKVALLVRHPADTVISRYHHLRDRSEDPARQLLARQPLEEFVWTEQGGVPAIVEYMNQWGAICRQRGDIHLVRYEDVLADPERQIQALARFVGLEASDATVADAVSFGKIDNLKQREREGYFDSSRFGAGRSGGEDSFKVRSGKAGGYRAKLSADNVERIDRYVADHLDPMFGYHG
ncbi:sulfotransferase domain-containing protein [Sphingomonas jaspsi]|uniref:sulfotransferase domain-containing protein n=1 Tax=Sphingomonas jaspsi TaxID=392409 RepID=UPI0004B8C3A9|nr:sulfotransferase domain-containing protein [Sphingomonas jaspsi]